MKLIDLIKRLLNRNRNRNRKREYETYPVKSVIEAGIVIPKFCWDMWQDSATRREELTQKVGRELVLKMTEALCDVLAIQVVEDGENMLCYGRILIGSRECETAPAETVETSSETVETVETEEETDGCGNDIITPEVL